MTDIEVMFHQVKVPPEEPNSTTRRAHDGSTPIWWSFISESPSCANFALKKTAEDNKARFDSETVRTVKRNFYVDERLKSVTSGDGAFSLVGNLTELCAKMVFVSRNG